MPINRCLSTNNTASDFAYVIPKLLLTPCAAALIWVQIAQLTQIRFSLMAPISVGLFSTVFLIVIFGMARKSFLRSFAEDLSWLPLATSCLIFALLGFVLVQWDADDSDIPIFSGNHPLIYARMIETEFWFQTRGNPQKGERRRFAMKFASGLSPANEESFFQVINEEPAIRSLVLKPEALKSARVLERIITNGFNDIGRIGRYRVFIRNHI